MRKVPIMKPYFDDEEAKAAAEALASGWVAQGPRVAEFEKLVAAHEGCAFGVATTNCTTALHLLMVCMGFGPGMDVLVPSFTFVATGNAVEYTGANAILVDVNPLTFNIDVSKLDAFVAEHYHEREGKWINVKTGNVLAGIVPVNEFGLCADIPAVNAFAARYGLKVVEDSACALGAKIGDTHQGGFGNPSAVSFHPRKSISTGEGGMALVNDPQLAEHLRQLRSHAASISEVQRNAGKGYLLPEYNELGFNYRMTDIQGAIGCAQMKKLDYIAERRAELARRYDRLLPQAVPYVRIPTVPEGYTHIYQTYCTMVLPEAVHCDTVDEANAFRNAWMDRLEQNGIATRQGTHALHTLGYYVKKYGFKHEDLPCAYACDRLSLAIPLFVEMSDEDQDYVIEHMASIAGELLR